MLTPSPVLGNEMHPLHALQNTGVLLSSHHSLGKGRAPGLTPKLPGSPLWNAPIGVRQESFNLSTAPS